MILYKRTCSPFSDAMFPLRIWLALPTAVVCLLRTVTPLQRFLFDLPNESNKASTYLALQTQVLFPFTNTMLHTSLRPLIFAEPFVHYIYTPLQHPPYQHASRTGYRDNASLSWKEGTVLCQAGRLCRC